MAFVTLRTAMKRALWGDKSFKYLVEKAQASDNFMGNTNFIVSVSGALQTNSNPIIVDGVSYANYVESTGKDWREVDDLLDGTIVIADGNQSLDLMLLYSAARPWLSYSLVISRKNISELLVRVTGNLSAPLLTVATWSIAP